MRGLALVLAGLVLVLTACGGGRSDGDREEIEQTIKTWLLEHDCDLMTDRFLDTQTVGIGDNREQRCELFEQTRLEPQYGEDDIEVSEVSVDGSRATATVANNTTDVRSKYTLVKRADRWLIDVVEPE